MLSLEFEIASLEISPLALRDGSDYLASLPARANLARRASQPSTGIAPAKRGNIAVLPLYGLLVQRPGILSMLGLATSTQQFAQALRAAVADPSIGSVVIDCDSGGGSIYGIQELADTINSLRSTKPIVCVANSLAASAAYWIGSACSRMYCTPGGEVGGIGVVAGHTDLSRSLEKDGVKMTLISAGKRKTEGNPFQPLDAEGRAAIQQSVDNYYGMFTKAVSRGRGVSVAQVRDGFGQGRCLSAADALAQNMIDGIATIDQIVARMQKSGTVTPRTGSAARSTNPRFNHEARRLELLH